MIKMDFKIAVLNTIYNIFVIMESETDDINRYLKKVGVDKEIDVNDIFNTLEKVTKELEKR
jgi:hypothetical protein